ncbi:MAG: DeoR/GlpR transcriptional regulator [Firmicutes bacterium HGW-Firmicutes-7]|nr:MAG: DeoR/GlpR transcriptional regulator [Firmicutes bacterium HGW-Firmicutes-7]
MSGNRLKIITDLLDETGSVSLNELSKVFPDVSVMTLRRDLIQLENEGTVIRTHGGAVKTNKLPEFIGEESAYQARENEHKEAKKTIAKKALAYVETGRSIFFDSGSTIMSLTNLLPDETFSIITSGVNIAEALLKKQNPSVIVLGGFANKHTFSMSGPLSSTILDTLNIDIAFMSASGFSFDNNFTVSNIYEAELKKKVIAKAKKVVILMDTSKINKVLPYTFAALNEVNILITEGDLPLDIKNSIQEAAVTLI